MPDSEMMVEACRRTLEIMKVAFDESEFKYSTVWSRDSAYGTKEPSVHGDEPQAGIDGDLYSE